MPFLKKYVYRKLLEYYKTLLILFTTKLLFLLVVIEFYLSKQRKNDSKIHFYQWLLNFIVSINIDKAIIHYLIMSDTIVFTNLLPMLQRWVFSNVMAFRSSSHHHSTTCCPTNYWQDITYFLLQIPNSMIWRVNEIWK